jgi:LysR family transcriptional regulator, low CO2-responsive transcriptional regulator
MGRPPHELKTQAFAFARHPMAFVAAPSHPLMSMPGATLADVAGAKLLARERGSGTRTTLERLFKDAGVVLRVSSELSSNEAIKQMCAAGLGVAFLSMHTCTLEIGAGVLAPLPLQDNPIEREWFAMHLATRPLRQAGAAFERFLLEHGQRLILEGLAGAPRGGQRKARRRVAIG